MDNNLRRRFENTIISTSGSDFHDFVSKLFIKRFGEDFVPVKQKRDRGCDGILENKKFLAIYGPSSQRRNLKEFILKSTEDFEKYKDKWEKKYQEWCFVYNDECTIDRIEHLKSLKPGVIIYDLKHLMNIIEELTFPKLRELANYLGIFIEYFRNDILKQIIEDLIKKPFEDIEYEINNPKDIDEKIKLNYDMKDFDLIRKKHETAFVDIEALKILLRAYDDTEISAMKMKVLNVFAKISGDFKEKMTKVNEILCDTYENDMYKYFIDVILLYLFEACIVGKKP